MTDKPQHNADTLEAREELRRRMAEAAALDASDPMRRDLLREIVAAGDWACNEWVDLVADDERVRLELIDAAPSGSLHRRLLELPDSNQASAPTADRPVVGAIGPRPWTRPLASIAAAVLIGVTIWLALGPLSSQASAARFEAFGSSAVEHHLMDMPMILQTDNVGTLDQRLRGTVDFPYHLPDLTAEGYTLIGARPCHLNGHDIIQSQWTRDGQVFSVYVFCTSDFDLPSAFERRQVQSPEPASDGQRRQVTMWSGDDNCAYAIIPDETVASL